MTENQEQVAAGERPTGPILPHDSVVGRALVAVIAIMSFLAALTVGAVQIVQSTAAEWRNDMAREVTIQIRPVEGRNFEADVRKTVEIAKNVPGVADAHAYTKEEAEKLLEPWIGPGIDLGMLPVPRLIRVRVEKMAEPGLAGLRGALSGSDTGATLDDHRSWSSRLSAISSAVTLTGIAVLALMLTATVLSVSFATRGAVAANRPIVEVLHFVGARDSYVANAFQHHFLIVGLKGGAIGGALATVLFIFSRLAADLLGVLSGGDAALFFGNFGLGGIGYLGIAAVVGFVAFITALSSRLTVYRTLRTID